MFVCQPVHFRATVVSLSSVCSTALFVPSHCFTILMQFLLVTLQIVIIRLISRLPADTIMADYGFTSVSNRIAEIQRIANISFSVCEKPPFNAILNFVRVILSSELR